jgi:hypothetical protein
MAGYELVLYLYVWLIAKIRQWLDLRSKDSDRLAKRWLIEVPSSSDVDIYELRMARWI